MLPFQEGSVLHLAWHPAAVRLRRSRELMAHPSELTPTGLQNTFDVVVQTLYFTLEELASEEMYPKPF